MMALGLLAMFDPDRAVVAVEGEQHQPGDDGGQGEGKVDQDLDQALAEELVADQHPGDEGAHDDVDRRDQQGLTHRQADGRSGLLVGDRAPERAPSPFRRGGDHGGEGDEDEQAEPDEGDAEAEAGRAGEPPGDGQALAPDDPRGLDGQSHEPLPDLAIARVTMPLFSSKNFVERSLQLTKSSLTVSSVLGAGNGFDGIVRPLHLAVVDAVDDRTEALEGELLLALGAEDEVEPLGGLRGGVDQHRAGVLDEHRGVRDDVVELLAVLAGEDRLVLVRHQHVTGAAEEGGGGVTAAAGEGDDVGEEAVEVVGGLGLGATVGDHLAVGGQRVPTGRTGRAGVRASRSRRRA